MKQFSDELKHLLADNISQDKINYLPSGFQRIGDIIMLNLKPELKAYEKGIGKVILKLFPKVKTVCTKSGSNRDHNRSISLACSFN